MPRTRALAVAIALTASLVLTALVTGCNGTSSHPGREAFERACSRCHKISRPLAKAKTRHEWQRTVTVMKKRGARLSDEETKLVVDYLMEVRGVK